MTLIEKIEAAKKLYYALTKELLLKQSNSRANHGDKCYLIPVEYKVRAMVEVCAPNLEVAEEYIHDMDTPLGVYVDDSFVVNPDKLSEHSIFQSMV